MGFSDEWVAYDFDTTLAHFGILAQNRLDETDENGKHTHDIYKALNVPKPRTKNPHKSLWQNVQGVNVKD